MQSLSPSTIFPLYSSSLMKVSSFLVRFPVLRKSPAKASKHSGEIPLRLRPGLMEKSPVSVRWKEEEGMPARR